MNLRTLPLWVLTTFCALLLGAGLLTAPAGAEQKPEWGTTTAPDQVLRKGCHNYKYRYDIHPPEGVWALETFIKGPSGKSIASSTFSADYDPNKDTVKFRTCKPVTRYGRWTIKAKITVQNGYDEYTEGWLKPSHFRMKRPR